MTKQQIEICKIIRKYKNLNIILKKTGMKRYQDLLEEIPMEYLKASNLEMDDTTEISLSNSAIEIVEDYEDTKRHIKNTETVAVLGLILAAISLIWQIVEALC